MEILQYIRLFRKWLWLILLAAFVAGGISFVVSSSAPPSYQAAAMLSVGQYIQDPNPSAGSINLGRDLAQTYAQLIRTYDILQATVDAYDLPFSPDALGGSIDTRVISLTTLLEIRVTASDPQVAATAANGLAEQLILRSPTNLTPEQQAQVDFAQAQIDQLSAQQTDSRQRLQAIDTQLSVTSDVAQITQLTEQRNLLIEQINAATASIAEFTSSIGTYNERSNSITIVDPARVPTRPRASNLFNLTLLGAAVGAVIASGIAFVVEYLDDTIRTTEQAAQVLTLPVLGAIVRYGRKDAQYAERLISGQPSMSPVAESYRTLRTNLLFASRNGRKAVYVITSCAPEEGKTVTSANLAVTMALAGLQVLLIDADLRRPKMHEVFNLENNVGLTTLLFADPGKGGDGDENQLPANLKQCLQSTSIPRLRVITSGFVPSNPTEILGSALMERWVETFRASNNIDVVLIDSPPCLLVADSSVLAATAKADVLLVIDSGRTRRGTALRAKDRFVNLGVEIKGVIVNRINPRDETYEYGYEHGYYYTSQKATGKNAAAPNRRLIGKRSS